jgi:hypothetical protein
MKPFNRILVAASLAGLGQIASAQNVFVSEPPNMIRVEQYTGSTGNAVLWRLPSPGATPFPDSTCLNLHVPSEIPEHASRFIAMYLYSKSNSKPLFYVFSKATCTILSFGIDG